MKTTSKSDDVAHSNELLLQFTSDEYVPSSVTDSDGDEWNLQAQGYDEESKMFKFIARLK